MKRVIHIGEGKHVEIEEGAIFRPPPAPRKKRPQCRPPYPEGMYFKKPTSYSGAKKALMASVPGYAEWFSLRLKQAHSINPNTGRGLGQAYGMTKRQFEKEWVLTHKQVKKDMAAIKKAGIDLDGAGEEALETTLTIMRGKTDLRLKLTAARQVLEWAKAKPVAKSEVTINKAEEWLASLAKEDGDEGDFEK